MRALAILLALWASTGQAACRQALALGLDISGSVDAREYLLQRNGLATALSSPAVQDVLFAPGAAPIRIAVYEWSGPTEQVLIVPWTELVDPATLATVLGVLQSKPRPVQSPTTAIGSALQAGFDLLGPQADCWKRTLDISGDGKANTGPLPQTIPVPDGLSDVNVNALVIGIAERPGGNWGAGIQDLTSYFEAYVLRGPAPFVEVALGYDDYADAMESKLLRELETLATSRQFHQD